MPSFLKLNDNLVYIDLVPLLAFPYISVLLVYLTDNLGSEMQWVQFYKSVTGNKLIDVISPFDTRKPICSSLTCQVSSVLSQSVLAATQAGVQQDVTHLLSRGLYCKIGLYFSVQSL